MAVIATYIFSIFRATVSAARCLIVLPYCNSAHAAVCAWRWQINDDDDDDDDISITPLAPIHTFSVFSSCYRRRPFVSSGEIASQQAGSLCLVVHSVTFGDVHDTKVASVAGETRKPCCRKETARCHNCFSFRFKVRWQQSLQVQVWEKPSFES